MFSEGKRYSEESLQIGDEEGGVGMERCRHGVGLELLEGREGMG